MIAATPSTDTIAPASSITSPSAGASAESGGHLTISGTASDAGGGIVAGVEVSVDGGVTWRGAEGGRCGPTTGFPARPARRRS